VKNEIVAEKIIPRSRENGSRLKVKRNQTIKRKIKVVIIFAFILRGIIS